MLVQHKVAVFHVDVRLWKGAENWLEGHCRVSMVLSLLSVHLSLPCPFQPSE